MTIEKMIENLKARKAELQGKVDTAESKEALQGILQECRSIDQQIKDLEDVLKTQQEERATAQGNKIPENAQHVNGEIATRASFQAPAAAPARDKEMEYRSAFMQYVLKGTPIPAELREDQQITTTETGYAIPLTLVQRIINTAKARYGALYRRARKMPIKGDVQVPITGDDIMMTWITETTPSERKKLNTVGRVLFNRYMAELKIAQSILSETVTLPAFENYIVEVVAKAFLRTMDYGIINGSGDGTMLGIANDARVTNVVTMTAAQMSDWKAWKTRFFANLPAGAEDGCFVFSKSTRITYLDTMCDSNGRPIFYEAADLTERSFFGREIDTVESSIIKDFDTATTGEVIGVYWDPDNYWITENADWTVERYKDQDKNQIVTKAIVIVDGKVVDPTGFVLIKKA